MTSLHNYDEYLPEDVLKEVIEAEREVRGKYERKRKRKPYPSSRDLVEAIIEAVATYDGHPDGFPDHVYHILERRGFYTKFVTVKRIWSTYEKLVRKGIISDRLNVVTK